MRRVSWQRLSTQVVITQVAVLIVTMCAGFLVLGWSLQRELDWQYEQRALAVARSLASQVNVAEAVAAGRPSPVGPVQQLAMAAQRRTGALFVVITNAQGIRFSHPNPKLIGAPVYLPDHEAPSTEPYRTGKVWLGVQTGTLGPEAVGKAPLWEHGALIGEVSVGYKLTTVAASLTRVLRSFAAYLLIALAGGVVVALGFARRLKRQTFGLELGEITALLQEREAMLHGIREAVLGYDTKDRVLLANDAARDLLRLPPDFVGRRLSDLIPSGRLADVISGAVSGRDVTVLQDGRILAANRMPIQHDHRRHLGWVVTFHDQTESESLKRELDEAIGLTETLRAQSHEFANRLHTLVGLVELGHYEEAIQFVTDVSGARDELTEQLCAVISDPRVVALMLAKFSLADERGVRLAVARDSRVAAEIIDVSPVLTVVGNLIDNAIEATALGPEPRWVELTIVAAGDDLLVRVRDSGPGVPEDARDQIFTDGYTTKRSPTGARRGIGLALVRQVVERRQGMISVGQDGGAVFTATLPRCLAAAGNDRTIPAADGDQMAPASGDGQEAPAVGEDQKTAAGPGSRAAPAVGEPSGAKAT